LEERHGKKDEESTADNYYVARPESLRACIPGDACTASHPGTQQRATCISGSQEENARRWEMTDGLAQVKIQKPHQRGQ
jgi:hypothetical protein